MLDVGFGAALIAGLLSFVSPCVLPIVPPYLAYLAGISFQELGSESVSAAMRRRIVLASLFFVLGFSTVFVALGQRPALSARPSRSISACCRSLPAF